VSARQWDVSVRVIDFGLWNPDDPKVAAALIRVVNAERQPGDAKPRVEAWEGGRKTLIAEINGERFSVTPGEHLTCAVLPRTVQWSGSSPDALAEMTP
jgi:hypothetical protein